jgi:hypothetical protein
LSTSELCAIDFFLDHRTRGDAPHDQVLAELRADPPAEFNKEQIAALEHFTKPGVQAEPLVTFKQVLWRLLQSRRPR